MAIDFSQSNVLFYTLKELNRIEEIILAKVSKSDVYFVEWVYPNGHSFFNLKTKNEKQITCTQTDIRFSI